MAQCPACAAIESTTLGRSGPYTNYRCRRCGIDFHQHTGYAQDESSDYKRSFLPVSRQDTRDEFEDFIDRCYDDGILGGPGD